MKHHSSARYARALILFSVVFLHFASAVDAQDGSVVPPSDPLQEAVPAKAAAQDPRDVPPPADAGTGTSPIKPDPSSAEQPAVPAAQDTAAQDTAQQPAVMVVEPEIATSTQAPILENSVVLPAAGYEAMTEASPTTSGFPSALIIALAVCTALGGYAAYMLRAKKKDQNAKRDDSEEENAQCLDLKKRMEEKLKELTDVKGQLQDAAKAKARGKAKEVLAGTAAGALLGRAEKLEGEYERFKKLYEQCIAHVPMRKRVFVVHCWDGSPDDGWYPWLKRKLEAWGYSVTVLTMPSPEEPQISAWVSHIAEQVGEVNQRTHFVGHSIGSQAVLRYLEQLPDDRRAGDVIFVAGWLTLQGLETDEEKQIARPWLETPVDFEKVKKNAKGFFALFSDNDPFVPRGDRKRFEDLLGAETVVMPGMGHFTEDDGVTELPAVVQRFEK